jgi:NAD(P)-dependent dehydrogenase (short-subunit alcohol dehydrogenase family)
MTRIDRVIVTGASSGIGFDLARRFLAEGSRVLINGRDEGRLTQARIALGAPADRLVAVAGDVGKRETAARLAEAAQRHFGGVDVLINNAGIFASKAYLESSEAELDAFYSANLKGTFLVSQAIVPLLIQAGGGSILNVGSVMVEQPTAAIPCAAAMAIKGGIHAFTRALASELAAHRIRVNTLAPGIIRTPLIGEAADSLAGMHPLKRVGEVQDTSDAALFLSRAGFVTGVTLDVDGGYAHAR